MLVIGDYIIDEYIEGTSVRLSPEAPVPVILNAQKRTFLGGAANVVENLKAFGEKSEFVYNNKQRIIKTRIVANGHILCRLDDEQYVPATVKIKDDWNKHRVAVLSDYNKGVLHEPKLLIYNLNDMGMKTLVDPKKPFKRYYGAWLIKANRAEFEKEWEQSFDLDKAQEACRILCDRNHLQNIIVTLGSEGCFVYQRDGDIGKHIRSEARTVLDVTGAGDVFMAALAHYIQKYDIFEAAEFANSLAGISVGHFGTYVLTKQDIASVKPKVIFTNGCFDILHRGHVDMLRKSKELGQKLIVGLNSDVSVSRLKGADRPINSQEDRKAVLEALGFVDEVIIFDEDTPYELIKKLRPNIITKGGDYETQLVIGSDLAPVKLIPYMQGYSSTGVIDEIKRKS